MACSVCDGGCHGNCSKSGPSSGCTCVGGSCGSGCSTCSTSCGGGCKTGCTGCGTACTSDCTGTCTGTCTGKCTGTCKNTCSGKCSGCSGCSGTCSGGCSGSCDGCSGGCTSCSNACTSLSMMNMINNLGQNIIVKGYIKAEDFIEIKEGITNELRRRNKLYLDQSFSNYPTKDNYTIPEHIQKSYQAVYNLNPAYDFRNKAYSGAIVYQDDMDDVIYYIRSLMAQRV